MSTELVLLGMMVAGVLLCLLGFWVEIRHRRHQQREETRRQHFFIRNHARALNSASEATARPMVEVPEPAANTP